MSFTTDTLVVNEPNGITVDGVNPVIPSDGFGALADGEALMYDSANMGSTPWVPEPRRRQTPTYASSMSINVNLGTEVHVVCTGDLTTWSINAGRYPGQLLTLVLERGVAGPATVNVTTPANVIWAFADDFAGTSFVLASPFDLAGGGGNIGDRGYFHFAWNATESKWFGLSARIQNQF